MADDPVLHPDHYVSGRKYEPIDVLQEVFPHEPLLWNAAKYLSRAGRKADLHTDLAKALNYVERRIAQLDKGVQISIAKPSIDLDSVLVDWYGLAPAGSAEQILNCCRDLFDAALSPGLQQAHDALMLCKVTLRHVLLFDLATAGTPEKTESPFTFEEFDREAQRTIIFPDYAKLYYPALGLCGEAGEVAEKVKKLFRDYNGTLTDDYRSAIVQEVGDVLWYVSAMCRDLGVPMEAPAKACIAKLKSRAERGTLKGNGDER